MSFTAIGQKVYSSRIHDGYVYIRPLSPCCSVKMDKIYWRGDLSTHLRKCTSCSKIWRVYIAREPTFPDYTLWMKPMPISPPMNCHGDCNTAVIVNTITITEDFAQKTIQAIVERQLALSNKSDVISTLSWVTIVFPKRLTMRRAGCYDSFRNRITLYPRGMTLGTLLHEITHAMGYMRHNKEFKVRMAELVAVFTDPERGVCQEESVTSAREVDVSS